MTYELIITATAELHTLNACLYYEEQQTGLSELFLTELHSAYMKITEHPQYYTFIAANIQFRDIKLYRFPYVVIYEIHNNEVIVIAVFNTHREPLY